jgi:hypothetical protein
MEFKVKLGSCLNHTLIAENKEYKLGLLIKIVNIIRAWSSSRFNTWTIALPLI